MNEVDVSQSSIMIAATIFAGVLGILSRSFLSTFREWSDAKRRTAIERDDADIADLKRQVDNLTARIEASDERERSQRHYLTEHAKWDRKAYAALVQAGIDIDPPPSIF